MKDLQKTRKNDAGTLEKALISDYLGQEPNPMSPMRMGNPRSIFQAEVNATD